MPAKELLELNRSSIKGLQLNSILMRGTRLQTGGIDADVDEYCHWTFPDDDQASGCPSYMMARRLKPHSERVAMCPPEETTDASSVLERSRRLLVRERPSIQPSESRRDIYDRYVAARAAKLSGDDAAATASAPPPLAAPPKLFNRVVAIKGEESYTYWYVLTYLPDLQWCHVAPLEQRGLFESNKGPSAGRAKWMLVNEEQGGEIDVGAGRCVVMEARDEEDQGERRRGGVGRHRAGGRVGLRRRRLAGTMRVLTSPAVCGDVNLRSARGDSVRGQSCPHVPVL